MESLHELDSIEKNMKQLYPTVSINEIVLVLACKNGCLEMLQWILFSDHTIKRETIAEFAFPIACENNNCEIARFLHNQYHIETISDEVIFSCCEDGLYDMLIWLYSVTPCSFYNIQGARLYELFYYSIEHYEICGWLNEIYEQIPITMKNHKLFLDACGEDNYHIVNLLIKIRKGGYYATFDENCNLIHYEITDELFISNTFCEKNIEDCVICYEVANVKILCNHFYCKRCLEAHVIKNGYWCPYCRNKFNETQLFYLLTRGEIHH